MSIADFPVVDVTDPELERLVRLHDLSDPEYVHADYVASQCGCASRAAVGSVVKAVPNTTGEVCASCGGMMIRTGTCTTCTQCASTGGCG